MPRFVQNWNPRDVPSRSGQGWFVEVGDYWYGPYRSRNAAMRANATLRGSFIFHTNELKIPPPRRKKRNDRPGWLI